MYNRRHRRRRAYAVQRRLPFRTRQIVGGLIILAIIYYGGSWILGALGVGNPIRSAAAVLTTEGRGIVNVSLEGEAAQRAEDGLKLYPGDRVMTGRSANASLELFERTKIRLDEATDIEVKENAHGSQSSRIIVRLTEGSIWAATPDLEEFSGAILRRISTPRMSFDLPSQTEAVITLDAITVYAADGLGVTVTIAGASEELLIGEGQQFSLPAGTDLQGDLYAHRHPLDSRVLGSTFAEESRELIAGPIETAPDNTVVAESTDELLSISTPKNESKTIAATIDVNGRVGSDVARVRVNGYQALIDRDKGTFFLELSLPDEDSISILIEAVDEEGNVLTDLRRTVSRDREPPAPPTVTSPVGSGGVFRTNATQIELRGTAPPGALGIVVNDYRLRLFQPGDTEWSYLADLSFDNFFPGENTFAVSAINEGGYESVSTVITVIQGEGNEGVVDIPTPEKPAEGGETPVEVEPPKELPSNAPLLPGMLRVTEPTAGTSHTAKEKEFLIEGFAPTGTVNMWVNGYRLRLFEGEKGFWNYIASVELGTLRRGRNEYKIVARNADGEILDQMVYAVEFRPGR